MTTRLYTALLSAACLLIFLGGAVAFDHGPHAAIPIIIVAGVCALLAMTEAWLREDA